MVDSKVLRWVLKDAENVLEDAIGRCREPNFNYNSSAFRIEDFELFRQL